MKRKILIISAFTLALVLMANISLLSKENNLPLSSLVVYAESAGSGGGGCYSLHTINCPELFGIYGGQRIICEFSGVYGAPYYCLETTCSYFSSETQHHCIIDSTRIEN